jgi:alginate O-acetyltransferase complex protein AlgI
VLTFIAVVVGWVLFRAADLATALAMLWAMAGGNGLNAASGAGSLANHTPSGAITVVALLGIAFLAPNTQQITRYEGVTEVPAEVAAALSGQRLRWRPTATWAAATALLMAVGMMNLSRVSEFLYFQF